MTTALDGTAISTVLLDADGVIQRTAPGWRDTLLSFLGPRAAAEGDSFLYEIFVAERPTMTGRIDFGDSLKGVLGRFGIDASVEEVLACSTWIDVYADMIDAVRQLRAAGILCCLATNQQTRRAAHMRSQLGYDQSFDRQFYSCELGLAKPDPGYFRAVTEYLGVTPDSVLFVDDNLENVLGARAGGLHADLFPRDGGRMALDSILRSHGVAGHERAPRVPERAHLPLLSSDPGGVG
jgi:HAD superfamily hydrolase (TIGR01509 family)